ncbi:MAG: nucleotide exchange factor GrpE [Candidatus Babeliales bacterium]
MESSEKDTKELNHHDEDNREESEIIDGPEERIVSKDEVALWREKFVALNADLANVKRRAALDGERMVDRMYEKLFKDLLPIVDSFDRACLDTGSGDQVVDAWVEGVILVRKLLYAFLEKYQVVEITQTKQFNPELHEALVHVATPDYASGDVVEVLEKGYLFKGRVLRPTKVSVAK